jgi:cell division control protein 6
VSEAIRTLPTQSKMVLMCIVMNVERGAGRLTTGDVYETYKEISRVLGMGPLTQRRITDLLSELDMMGIIHARVRSFGRGGRTKEIDLGVPLADTKKVLEEDDTFAGLKHFKQKNQMTLI